MRDRSPGQRRRRLGLRLRSCRLNLPLPRIRCDRTLVSKDEHDKAPVGIKRQVAPRSRPDFGKYGALRPCGWKGLRDSSHHL